MRLLNFDEVVRGNNRFLAEVQRAVDEEAELAAKHSVEHVQRFPLFKPQTGNLQKKQRARVIKIAGKGRRILITNTAPYADAINSGARPHTIVPRRRQFLRFPGKGGVTVFARAVNHPGNKPYKFGFRATQSAGRVLGQGLERRLGEIAKRF